MNNRSHETDSTATSSARPRLADPLLTPAQVVELLGYAVTEKTLANWRSLRIGPVATYVGRHPRYFLRDVQDWVDSEARDARSWWLAS